MAKKKITVASTLRATKRLLEKTSWIKGRLRQYDRRGNVVGYCIMGAFGKVDGPKYGKAHQAFAKAIEPAIERWYPTIPGFNDARATTFADVRKVFDLAIRRATRSR